MKAFNAVSKSLLFAASMLCAGLSHAGDLADTASVYLYATPGSWVNPGVTGQAVVWTHGEDGIFSASFNYSNPTSGVGISYHGDNYYDFEFAAPSYNKATNTNNGQVLTAGFYDKATRFPFNSPTRPGLDVSGAGAGNNILYGWFNVLEIEYNGTTGALEKFAVDFKQFGESKGPTGPSLYGSLRFNSDIAINPVPEPETYAMMMAGLGLLGWSARRRKQANAARAATC